MEVNAPRGTKDILPSEVQIWQYLEKKIRALCQVYGYEEIRTPTFEHTELFQRGIGEGTDVVDKEMYTFTDRGGRSITLRPENTASAVRAYLQNKLYAEGTQKLFYIGSMFRYDRPQAGRMREFHQFGVEALGQQDAAMDAEIILLAVELLKDLGLKDLSLAVNSVGCPKCRPLYREKLQDFFRDKLPEMCDDCKNRFEKNPMRLLDCKRDAHKDFMQDAPSLIDCLCHECKEHFHKLQGYLQTAGTDFTIDTRLVRGLDYYTKTAFEVKYPPLGAQSAVAGGGRYDGLVEEIGGSPTPAVGFALGMERLILALTKQNLLPKLEDKAEVFLVALGEEEKSVAFGLLAKLRQEGVAARMDYGGRSMKAQMREAGRSGASKVIIIGEDEIKENACIVKNMATGEQEKVPFDIIINNISYTRAS